VTTINVTKLYDQTGNGLHATQGTLASMPTLVLSPVTGLGVGCPAIMFNGSQFLATAASFPAVNQPLSFSSVAIRTSGSTDAGTIAASSGNDPEMIFRTANLVAVFAGGTAATQTQTDNVWHALHGVFNGASSLMNVDGSSGTPQINNQGMQATDSLRYGRDSFQPSGNFLIGSVNEGGVWPVAFTGANMTSFSTNMHSYWGF
jgi:hypothetical protein